VNGVAAAETDEPSEAGGMTMAKAAAADKAYSEIKRLRLLQLKGELVNRKQVVAHVRSGAKSAIHCNFRRGRMAAEQG
jgi:hypothetical protein